MFGVSRRGGVAVKSPKLSRSMSYDAAFDLKGHRFLANFWARKSTAQLANEAAQGEGGEEVRRPKRTLSALNLVGLGVGGIIGAGIFV